MVLDSEYPPDIRVENEIEQLLKLGHQITLACFTMSDQMVVEEKENMLIFRTKMSKLFRKTSVGVLKFPFYFNHWRGFLESIFKRLNFDVIHIHDLPLAQIGLEICKKQEVPFILDLHENWPALLKDARHTNTWLGKILSSNMQWEKYEEEMVCSADKIITVVEEMKQRIVSIGANASNVFVLPNYFNYSSLLENEISAYKGETLFYAGGLTQSRGLQIAINGLALMPKAYNNLQMFIAGYGNYESELRKLVDNLMLNDQIKFLGKLSQEEIYENIRKMDIMLLPHLKSVQTDNSSPNKLFQYMYFGKPVLASNCDSIQRIIKKEISGIIYQDDNPKDFADKLIQLIESNHSNQLGKNGRRAVLEKYNWKNNAVMLKTIYGSIRL